MQRERNDCLYKSSVNVEVRTRSMMTITNRARTRRLEDERLGSFHAIHMLYLFYDQNKQKMKFHYVKLSMNGVNNFCLQ